jgi:hypothetical protein
MERYNVEEDFIDNHSVEITKENMKILVNDKLHPFGHGYCLGSMIKGYKNL